MIFESEIVESTDKPIPAIQPDSEVPTTEPNKPTSFMDEESEFQIDDPVESKVVDIFDTSGDAMELPEPQPTPKPVLDDRRARELSFYATVEINPEDPIGSFNVSRQQLITKGESDLVNAALEQAREQDEEATELAVESIIADETVHPAIRKATLQTFVSTGFLPSSLKERFINKTASPNEGQTIAQQQSQEVILTSLQNRKDNQHLRVRQEDISKVDKGAWSAFLTGAGIKLDQARNTLGLGVTDLEVAQGLKELQAISKDHPIAAGLGGVASIIVPTLPAALLGGLPALGAMAFIGAVIQGTSRHAELGISVADQEKRFMASFASGALTGVDFALPIVRAATILKAMMLNAPANIAIGELDVALQNEILEAFPELKQPNLDLNNVTVNGVMGAVIGAVAGKKPVVPLEKQIPASSVADSMNVGSPKNAADFAANTIVEDVDGQVAATITGGKDAGAIVHDWYLPDFLPAHRKGDAPLNPDLRERIAEKVHALDNKFRTLFQVFRYDPNVINATKRFEDVKKIFDIVKESRAPYYQQSNSFLNITDGVSEGSMVFGPRNGGAYASKGAATKAMNKLQKSIDLLDEADKGKIGIQEKDGGHIVTWEWKKEYDDVSLGLFGTKATETRLLGMDVSAIARSRAGQWIFPTGRNRKVEQGALRGVERSALLEDALVQEFERNITKSKHKIELDKMINDAEELGKNTFTIKEISTENPHLSVKQVEDLFETWTIWRRIQDVSWNFTNRQMRNKLASEGMRGVYNKKGENLGLATDVVTAKELDNLEGGYVWDYEKNVSVPFDRVEFEQANKRVVKMNEPVKGEGDSYEFGIVGGAVDLHHLPQQVLPRVNGYSPRRTKENFFVDMWPKESRINGKRVTDNQILFDKLKTTKAAARTFEEGEEIVAQLAKDHPDMTIAVRRERMDRVSQMAEDMKVRGEMLQEARRRGERLPSVDPLVPARLEDRLVTAIASARTLAKTEAFSQWDQAFQKSFVKSYKDLIKGDTFPDRISKIEPPKIATKENEIRFKDAISLYKYYANQKQFQTYGDFIWKDVFHGIADIIEKVPFPKGTKRVTADAMRRLGGQGNLAFKYPKAVVSAAFIHLNPVRQWLIQPAQLREMYFIHPSTFAQSIANTFAIRAAIMGKSGGLSRYEKAFTAFGKKSSNMSEQEFKETLDAITESGMLQSIDKNTLVTGMFTDTQTMLKENAFQGVARIAKNAALAPIRATRAAGFDFAELTNRIGMYLQTKAIWQKQNPGKDWRTLENKEFIATEALKLSGAMNRAGNLPYQQGALSVFMQFSAINHKLTMNLLQDNATILSKQDRLRLSAVRFALYGGKYGLPAGVIVNHAMDAMQDEPIIQDPDNRAFWERGIIDYVVNRQIATAIDPDVKSDILIGKGLTPFSENFLPMFDFMVESWKLIDDSPSSNPRFPASAIFGSFGTAINEMKGWTKQKDMDTLEKFARISLEAAEIASGFRNASKGLLMLSLGDTVSSKGNPLGWEISKAEAYAKMVLGAELNKEHLAFEAVGKLIDRSEMKKEMAEDIYKQMVNVENKIGTDEGDNYFSRLSSFFTAIEGNYFDAQDKQEVMEEILKLDRNRHKSTRTSILMTLWKHQSDTSNKQLQGVINSLEGSTDPETIKWLKLWRERDTQL